MNRIALIDDHERIAGLACGALPGGGIEAGIFGRRDHAWQCVALPPCAAVIVGRGLPGGDGLALPRTFYLRAPHPPSSPSPPLPPSPSVRRCSSPPG